MSIYLILKQHNFDKSQPLLFIINFLLSSIQDMAFVFINNHFISISKDILIITLQA